MPQLGDCHQFINKATPYSAQEGANNINNCGEDKVLREKLVYGNGTPVEPEFRIHVGPIATGKSVREDPDLFHSLIQSNRKVLGVEMEAVAIGWVAEQSGIPSIIAKAVSDYG